MSDVAIPAHIAKTLAMAIEFMDNRWDLYEPDEGEDLWQTQVRIQHQLALAKEWLITTPQEHAHDEDAGSN